MGSDPTAPSSSASFSWLSLLGPFLKIMLDAFMTKQQADANTAARDSANLDLGAARAGNDTLTTIGTITGERASLPAAPDSDLDLARELRQRAQTIRDDESKPVAGAGRDAGKGS